LPVTFAVNIVPRRRVAQRIDAAGRASIASRALGGTLTSCPVLSGLPSLEHERVQRPTYQEVTLCALQAAQVLDASYTDIAERRSRS